MSNRSNLSSTKAEQRHGPALAFAALDRYIEKHIVLPVETVRNEGTLVDWGTGNGYPLYLFGLYNNAPTLRSVVDGTVDFIGGDDVTCSEARWNGGKALNRLGETPFVLVRQQALNEMLYGGRAWQIIRDRAGAVAEVYCIPLRFLRCNKDCSVFYYSEDWGVPGKRVKSVRYPSFRSDLDWATLTEEERDANASSILYAKGDIAQVYFALVLLAVILSLRMTGFDLGLIRYAFRRRADLDGNLRDTAAKHSRKLGAVFISCLLKW